MSWSRGKEVFWAEADATQTKATMHVTRKTRRGFMSDMRPS